MKKLKLSELMRLKDVSSSHYGVCLDSVDTSEIKSQVQRISFPAEIDITKNEVSSLFYTKLVAWKMGSKAETIVEIDPLNECNIRNALNFVSNLGCSLSLLPPDEHSQVEKDRFVSWAVEAMNVILSTNRQMYVYPVSGYLEFLISEALVGLDSVTPTDPYVVETFYSAMGERFVIEFKEALKAAVFAHFGGEDEFRLRALSQVIATHDHLKSDKVFGVE